MRISFVIPAFNEAGTVEEVLDRYQDAVEIERVRAGQPQVSTRHAVGERVAAHDHRSGLPGERCDQPPSAADPGGGTPPLLPNTATAP